MKLVLSIRLSPAKIALWLKLWFKKVTDKLINYYFMMTIYVYNNTGR